MNSLKRLLKYLKKYWFISLLAPLFVILEVIMDLLVPKIMSNIVNIGILNHDKNYIIWNVIIMMILTVLGIIGGVLSVYFSSLSSQKVGADIRKDIFQKISQLSFFQLDKMKNGHIVTVLTNDISIICTVLMMCMRLLFRVPVIMIGSLIMVLSISLKLSLILLIMIPIVVLLVTIIMKKAYPYFQITGESVDEVNTKVRENIGGISVVKAFVTEEYEKESFDQINQYARDIMIKAVRIIAFAMPSLMFCVNLATIFVLWFGILEIKNGAIELGDIIAFIQYLTNLLTSLLTGSMVIVMLSRSEVSAERICELLDIKIDEVQNKKTIDSISLKGKIEFQNVSFSYENGSGDEVLKDISFTAYPNETIAIIGATGSGKSTLVHLIAGFYPVTSGKIFLDDMNLQDYSKEYLRKNIGICLQHPFIFSDTILNNITYGSECFGLKEVEEAASIAHIDEFIREKEDGYHYVLEQQGSNLSGGQKQRIALARTILTHTQILILDDSTSAVDMKTEKEIRKSLKKFFKNHTIFIVAQRISSIMDADRILVLEDGQICGFGTHKELLEHCNTYQEIYYSQIRRD